MTCGRSPAAPHRRRTGDQLEPGALKCPDVFTQEASNPRWLLLIEILIAVPAAIMFARTRASWPAGINGGLVFGFFAQFFNPLAIEGFPCYLAWCRGGINTIVSLVPGAVLGGTIKRA